MNAQDFTSTLAEAIKDPDKVVITNQDWLQIMSSQAGEMFPEIATESTTDITYSTLTTTYQVDMSGSGYSGIQAVKSVYMINSDGRLVPFTNWVYHDEVKVLDLNPESSSEFNTYFSDVSYQTVRIVWLKIMDDFTENATVNLDGSELDIFRKICVKEAINRILMDHFKLDRYRTLVGRSNEYVMMAQARSLAMEIEMRKSKITRSNKIRSF